jgi:hypothetical protein
MAVLRILAQRNYRDGFDFAAPEPSTSCDEIQRKTPQAKRRACQNSHYYEFIVRVSSCDFVDHFFLNQQSIHVITN